MRNKQFFDGKVDLLNSLVNSPWSLLLINFSSAVPRSTNTRGRTMKMILVCSLTFTLRRPLIPVTCPEGWIHYHSNPILLERQITSTRYWNSKRVFGIWKCTFSLWFAKYSFATTSLQIYIWNTCKRCALTLVKRSWRTVSYGSLTFSQSY